MIDNGVIALDCLLSARSLAVVGASNDQSKLGYALLDTIRRSGYEGGLYPVNRRAEQVQGIPAYPSVSAVPHPIEAAVILVPATYVAGVIREASAKGVRAAAILSAGFRESGRPDLEAELGSVARGCGVRLLGPNIQGFSYLPNRLCAMFWPAMTTPGPLAVIGQSGSVTAALAEWAADEGLGISAAVNLGNQVDLCESDVLEFLAQDDHTRAIALHLEAVKDGRRFLEVAERVARAKPVAVLKTGRSSAGRESAASHTGSLSGRDEVFEGACRQVGLVRVDDLQGLYDTAKGLATMRQPRGNRLFVVSTSGGGGTLIADEAERRGLVLPPLPQALVEELSQIDPPPNASLGNPLDLPSFSAAMFEGAVSLACRHDVADVYLISFGDPVPGSAVAVQRLSGKIDASLGVAYFGGGEVERASRVDLHRAGIPVWPTPEQAVRAVAAAVWRTKQLKGPEVSRHVGA
jgi:acyl-CoA synthetase (NDP forming)